jgi:hypothetical protein
MKVGHMEDPLEVMDGSRNHESRQEIFGSQLSRQYSMFNLMSAQDLSANLKAMNTHGGTQV